MRNFLAAACAVTSLLAVSAPAHATQIILAPGDVYAATPGYDSRFEAGNILDQQTGPISEQSQNGTYWLNADNGPSNAFIQIDLGAAYELTSLELFNTHNANYDDRGTGDFSIVGSNDSNFATSVTLVSGTLLATSQSVDPLPGQSFAVTDTGSYRYLEFLPTSVAVSGAECCAGSTTSYGLNELRVFAVPEPTTWAMMLAGFGLIGLAMRRRSTVKVSLGF